MGLIIGTAGHVDHGKTALIKRLTGIDTDRFSEEKERGLSIDLGFAPLNLPSGKQLGVIDVPGHEKFMSNMLAGVAGMNLVLLVIDLTEGIMPQTKEHLTVLSILGIKKGIIVFTKADLVDQEWTELMIEEVKEGLKGTNFEKAPFVITSAVANKGFEELINLIDQISSSSTQLKTDAPLRLPVDRSFKLTGLGTIVTGTLISGVISKGEEIELMPSGLKTRVRQIQIHNQKVNQAGPGQRVAVNLAGIDQSAIKRGHVIIRPDTYQITKEIDVILNLVVDSPYQLKNDQLVHLHLGTAKTIAKVKLFEQKNLTGGQEGLARLELREALLTTPGDLFIIRFYSPVQVIGGGKVLVCDPPPFQRRNVNYKKVLNRMLSGANEDLLYQVLYRQQIVKEDDLIAFSKLGLKDIQLALQKLAAEVFALPNSYYMLTERYKYYQTKLIDIITKYHQQHNLRLGFPKSQVNDGLSIDWNLEALESFLDELRQAKQIKIQGNNISLPHFKAVANQKQQQKLTELVQKIQQGGFAPPLLNELTASDVGEMINFLVQQKQLIRITENFYLTSENYAKAKKLLVDYLQENEKLTIADFRNLLQNTRKYALPLLEHFDEIKLTKRIDDQRVLNPKGLNLEQ